MSSVLAVLVRPPRLPFPVFRASVSSPSLFVVAFRVLFYGAALPPCQLPLVSLIVANLRLPREPSYTANSIDGVLAYLRVQKPSAC